MTYRRRASWRIPASSLAGLVLLVYVCGCGTSGTRATDSGSASRFQARAPSRTPQIPGGLSEYPVVTYVEPPLLRGFALFRKPPDGLPTATRRVLSAPIFGANRLLARRIPVKPPEEKSSGAYWLVPGDAHLCIMAQGVGGEPGISTTCAQTSHALAHGIADITITPADPAAHTPESRLIVGMAPDGIRKVLVHTHGVIETAPIIHGIFTLRDSIAAPPDFTELRR